MFGYGMVLKEEILERIYSILNIRIINFWFIGIAAQGSIINYFTFSLVRILSYRISVLIGVIIPISLFG